MTVIRIARRADLPAAADILEAAGFTEHASGLRDSYNGKHDEDGTWLVAIDNNTIIGTAHADLNLDYSDVITDLGYAPPHA